MGGQNDVLTGPDSRIDYGRCTCYSGQKACKESPGRQRTLGSLHKERR